MFNLEERLNYYKKEISIDGELFYVDVEFSEQDVLISLMSIDTHLRKISVFSDCISSSVKLFDNKMLEEGIFVN
jgi:hypothetical protein